MTELSDDLLVAYVDGQLARDQSRAVKRVLDQDFVAAHRAETLRVAHDRLEWVLDSLLEDERVLLLGDIDPPPPSPPPRPSLRDRISKWGTATLVSAGFAVALLGLSAGYAIWGGEQAEPAPAQEVAMPAAPAPAQEAAVPAAPAPAQEAAVPATPAPVQEAAVPATPAPVQEAAVPAAPKAPVPDLAAASWQTEVTRAQALVARESLEVGLESQANLDFVRFQLARAVGTDVVIPDLSGQGLKFARAQILRYEGEPLAQISYLPATGAPFALYVKPGAASDTGPVSGTGSGLASVEWSAKGIAYLFTGQTSQAEILRVATIAREQTSGP